MHLTVLAGRRPDHWPFELSWLVWLLGQATTHWPSVWNQLSIWNWKRSVVDRRGLPAAQIVAFVDEGVRLCGMLGGEDPSFLPLLTSFLNVRSQLRQETADGVVLDANRWRKACGQIDISLQPQDLTMAVLAYTNDQSAWLFARRATFNSENLLRLPPTTWLSTHRFWEWLRYRSSSHWWQGWTNWPLLPSLWQTACQKMSIH